MVESAKAVIIANRWRVNHLIRAGCPEFRDGPLSTGVEEKALRIAKNPMANATAADPLMRAWRAGRERLMPLSGAPPYRIRRSTSAWVERTRINMVNG